VSRSKISFYLFVFTTVVLLSDGIVGCREKPRGVMLNEPLRLTPEQIAAAEKEAATGDAAAAKKLWHHYTFGAGDHKKGEAWKAMYEKLSQRNADSK
jgi:hypothetical protein